MASTVNENDAPEPGQAEMPPLVVGYRLRVAASEYQVLSFKYLMMEYKALEISIL
jgi:hypothetical protein